MDLLKSDQVNEICFLASLRYDSFEIQTVAKKVWDIELSFDEINEIIENNYDLVRNWRENDYKSVLKSIELGILRNISFYDRIRVLDQIIEDSSQGYEEEMVNNKGEVITVKKRNFQSAISAISLVNEMIGQSKDEEYIDLIVTETDPNNRVIRNMALASEIIIDDLGS